MGHSRPRRVRPATLAILRRHARDNAVLQRKALRFPNPSPPTTFFPHQARPTRPFLSTLLTTLQVDSPESLENVETKWVGEIAENCPGVKLVLVALKCDLREKPDEDDDGARGAAHGQPEKMMIDYNRGLAVAEKIRALRYLGMLLHHPFSPVRFVSEGAVGFERAMKRGPGGGGAGVKWWDGGLTVNSSRMLGEREPRC